MWVLLLCFILYLDSTNNDEVVSLNSFKYFILYLDSANDVKVKVHLKKYSILYFIWIVQIEN